MDFSHTLRKQRLALGLAVVAGLSFAYAAVRDLQEDVSKTRFTGVITALAKDDASGSHNYDMFLKVDTVTGDATDFKHRNEISVDSFSWNESRAIGAPRPSMDAFVVTMPGSSASPKLFLYGAGGTRIPRVALSVKMKGGSEDFLKWVLTDAQVLSYKTVTNTHGDGVMDQVTFSFAKIETEMHQVLPDGSLGPAAKAGWDQRTNKAN
ncbi:type VI secretion system tube protein Hcp [Candidatus Peribacteria bacterium]|nr:type VI secretion system tube protein Hcp [Candidatus Peribacteria bacterium]